MLDCYCSLYFPQQSKVPTVQMIAVAMYTLTLCTEYQAHTQSQMHTFVCVTAHPLTTAGTMLLCDS